MRLENERAQGLKRNTVCVILVVVALAGLSSAASGQESKHLNHKVVPSPPALVAAPTEPPRYTYPYKCGEQQALNESQLCVATISAVAAQDSARWAMRAFWAGLFEAAALILTLIFSAIATVASWITANSARRSVEIYSGMLEQAQAQTTTELRAWVTVDTITVNQVSAKYSKFTIGIKNIGRSPGRYLVTARLSGAFNAERPADAGSQDSDDFTMAIAPNERQEIVIYTDWENRGVPPPKLYCRIRYKDGVSDQVRLTERLLWIGGSADPSGVTSLVYDVTGAATGVALLLWQDMS